MDCWHLTFAARDRRHLFPTEATRLDAVRRMVRMAGSSALLWCVVDDHVHLVVEGERAVAGRLAQRLLLAFSSLCGARSLAPVHITEVVSRKHLYNLLSYLLRQPAKHGIGVHPARWEGSCFMDLVGARRLPGHDPATLSRHVPRLVEARILEAADLGARFFEGEVQAPSLEALVAAGAAMVGAANLEVATEAVVRARRLVAVSARVQGWSSAAIADAMGVAPRTVRRQTLARIDPADREALRRQLLLQGSVGRSVAARVA